MKKTRYIFGCMLTLLLMVSSCTKESSTANLSRITYFVDLNLLGDELVLLKQNENFEDPGAEASENGNPVEVVKTGAIDNQEPDFYELSYSATNSDGFPSSVTRTVAVYEPMPITGVYDGRREGRSGGLILIKTQAEGEYFISDLIGGHYEFERGFGPAFAAPATIRVVGDKIESDGGVCGFGPVAISEGQISEDQRTWSWKMTLTDFDFSFTVIIEKITE